MRCGYVWQIWEEGKGGKRKRDVPFGWKTKVEARLGSRLLLIPGSCGDVGTCEQERRQRNGGGSDRRI
jgi:hypothetical protein